MADEGANPEGIWLPYNTPDDYKQEVKDLFPNT